MPAAAAVKLLTTSPDVSLLLILLVEPPLFVVLLECERLASVLHINPPLLGRLPLVLADLGLCTSVLLDLRLLHLRSVVLMDVWRVVAVLLLVLLLLEGLPMERLHLGSCAMNLEPEIIGSM